MPDAPPTGQLKRQIGLFHAVLLGLGSILGTGVFVSIGIAAGLAGPAVIVAIVLAALLALCNGLSSAQLAAAHPVAGGTYEYGYRFLHPKLGFTAGWMFLLAKSASAATAGLAVGYAMVNTFDLERFLRHAGMDEWFFGLIDLKEPQLVLIIGLGCVIGFTALVCAGLKRTSIVNAVLVLFTLTALAYFTYRGFFGGFKRPGPSFTASFNTEFDILSILGATSLCFVAFTGYGRIATLGEEVVNPRKTIPIAILSTLAVCVVFYLGVGATITRAMPTDFYSDDTDASILFDALEYFAYPPPRFVTLFLLKMAASIAMLGVLLNLVLGLSRVLLAMGRRHDVPGFFKSVNASGTTPVPAVIGVGVLIALLTLIGDIKTTWSFSAFTVLIYYGITNLAALRLPAEQRLYPRGFAYAGLAGCLFLCWWVEPAVWLAGCGLIVVGLIWHALAPRMFGLPAPPWEKCSLCGYDLRASTSACPECGTPIPEPPAT